MALRKFLMTKGELDMLVERAQRAEKKQAILSERVTDALGMIYRYGGFDGAHHKQWVLDQVARVLNGCTVVSDEYNASCPETNGAYIGWVTKYQRGEDGPLTYEWDEGVPP